MKKVFLTISILIMIAVFGCIAACGKPSDGKLKDGEYQVNVKLEGGSGRASLASPAKLIVNDGVAVALIEWSSPNYDYMIVDGQKYLAVNTEGNSAFEIPVIKFDEPFTVIADTTAMSTPHEIEYQLTFSMKGAADGGKDKTDSGRDKTDKDEFDIPDTLGDSIVWKSSMELEYANGFSVDYYENEKNKAVYKLLTIKTEGQYLVADNVSGDDAFDGIDITGITLIKDPSKIYLVASPVMDMFVSMGALDTIAYSALEKDDWHVDGVGEKMDSGDIIYAGKYSAPDYELLLSGGCGLAIENTMIYHSPEVREKIESFGIPVIVDRSSYETQPLGRSEWVKLYGAITGKEQEALDKFNQQVEIFKAIDFDENADRPTVAFFYISSNGEVKVRKSGDYLAKMINLAGGSYIFSDLGNDDETATMSMQMEQFYLQAKDADYIIYNSTIDGELGSLADLIAKSELIANMKAVKEGNVFCTSANLYQASMALGTITGDINGMINDRDDMTYIYRIK